MKYEIYGSLHKIAKRLLCKNVSASSYRMISVRNKNIDLKNNIIISEKDKSGYINDIYSIPAEIGKKSIFPIENIVKNETFLMYEDSFRIKRKCHELQLGISDDNVVDIWLEFVKNSKIPSGFRNDNLHYAGYIWDCEEWSLPSWIWTNAALVRMYCKIDKLVEARIIVDRLVKLQQPCGGWVVRNDYNVKGAVPVLAPNDSAYIANNACIEYYLATHENQYLQAACKCADWIIETAREDGMIYVGFDMKKQSWQKKHNIVDVGFTAGLFARLFEITKDHRYLMFLKCFTDRFIDLFYIKKRNGFATSLNEEEKQIGGMFGRGQAWALEGLIPASRVLKDEKVTCVVQNTINNLLKNQRKNGGWPYNISRPLMGIDCKATSVIACSLMEWYAEHLEQKTLLEASKKAYRWCIMHTLPKGKGRGGIYSYTVEGSIVHHLYTWTAFVYASSYAIELDKKLAEV